jgi:hypothetical protein
VAVGPARDGVARLNAFIGNRAAWRWAVRAHRSATVYALLPSLRAWRIRPYRTGFGASPRQTGEQRTVSGSTPHHKRSFAAFLCTDPADKKPLFLEPCVALDFVNESVLNSMNF